MKKSNRQCTNPTIKIIDNHRTMNRENKWPANAEPAIPPMFEWRKQKYVHSPWCLDKNDVYWCVMCTTMYYSVMICTGMYWCVRHLALAWTTFTWSLLRGQRTSDSWRWTPSRMNCITCTWPFFSVLLTCNPTSHDPPYEKTDTIESKNIHDTAITKNL